LAIREIENEKKKFMYIFAQMRRTCVEILFAANERNSKVSLLFKLNKDIKDFR